MKRELLKRRLSACGADLTEGIADFEAVINRRKPALLASAEKVVTESE